MSRMEEIEDSQKWHDVSVFFAGVAVGAVLAYVVWGVLLLLVEHFAGGDAHPCPAGCDGTVEARVAAGRNRANRGVVRQSETGGKSGTVQRFVADADLNDGERDGADVGDDDLAHRDETDALLDRFDGGTGNVAKFLATDGAKRGVCGGASRSRSHGGNGERADGHHEFNVHGGDYSKKSGEGEAERERR